MLLPSGPAPRAGATRTTREHLARARGGPRTGGAGAESGARPSAYTGIVASSSLGCGSPIRAAACSEKGYLVWPCAFLDGAGWPLPCCWQRSPSPRGPWRMPRFTSTWRSTTTARRRTIRRRARPSRPRAGRNPLLRRSDPTTTATSTWSPYSSARPAAPIRLRTPRCPQRRLPLASSQRDRCRFRAKPHHRVQAPSCRGRPIRELLRSPRAGVSSAVRFAARQLSRRRAVTSAPS